MKCSVEIPSGNIFFFKIKISWRYLNSFKWHENNQIFKTNCTISTWARLENIHSDLLWVYLYSVSALCTHSFHHQQPIHSNGFLVGRWLLFRFSSLHRDLDCLLLQLRLGVFFFAQMEFQIFLNLVFLVLFLLFLFVAPSLLLSEFADCSPKNSNSPFLHFPFNRSCCAAEDLRLSTSDTFQRVSDAHAANTNE